MFEIHWVTWMLALAVFILFFYLCMRIAEVDTYYDMGFTFFFPQEDHRSYQKKLEMMISAQKKCMESIAHHRYRIKKIHDSLKKCVVTMNMYFNGAICLSFCFLFGYLLNFT